MKSDLETLSDTLDEHILKGLTPKRVSRVAKAEQDIAKGLSHNPFAPHEMNPDSPFYSPYQLTGEGYMPFPVEYWEGQGKDREGYATTIQLYERMRPVNKSLKALRDISKAIENDLMKGGVPIGTVHTYRDGQRYKKIAEGKWTPMAGIEKRTVKDYLSSDDPKRQKIAHDTLESHAGQIEKIKEILKKKTEADDFKVATTTGAVQETMGHVKKILGKLFDGPMPKELEQHIEDAISGKTKKEAGAAGDSKPADSAPAAEAMPPEDQKKLKAAEASVAGGSPHKVTVSFTHNGKKYDHEFPRVVAHTPGAAQQKIEDTLKKELGGSISFNRFRAEKVKAPEAQV